MARNGTEKTLLPLLLCSVFTNFFGSTIPAWRKHATVLIQGKFAKCMQLFILYEGHVTQVLTVVDGEVVTKRN
jgi:hypothetical protein